MVSIKVAYGDKKLTIPLAVPKLRDNELEQLAARINPVIPYYGRLYYIEPVDPRRMSFNQRSLMTIPAYDLEELVTILTLHEFGAPAYFKPYVADVLAQIPPEYLDKVVAFSTQCNPDMISEWSEPERIAYRHGFHLATTTLYTSR